MKMRPALPALLVAMALLSCQTSPEGLDVGIPLPASVPAGNFVLSVDYSASGASPKLDEGRPLCASILQRDKKVSFSDDGRGRLRVVVNTPEALVAPLEVAACRMLPDKDRLSAREISAALDVELVAVRSAATPTRPQPLAEAVGGGGGRAAEPKDKQPSPAPPAAKASPAPAPPKPSATDRTARARPWPSARADRDKAPTQGGGEQESPDGSRSAASPAPPRPSSGQQRERDDSGDPAALPPTSYGEPTSDGPRTAAERPGTEGGHAPAEGSVRPWNVTIAVTSGAGPVAALQFDVAYEGTSGSFVGRSQSVDCQVLVDVALSTGNNQRQGRLAYAMVDLNGFDVPADVLTCTFKTRNEISPEDFRIKVVDATDSDGTPLKIGMAVSDARRLD